MIFSIVMRNPEFCRGLLERIFPDRKIKEVRMKCEMENQENMDAEKASETDFAPNAGISDGRADTERTVAVTAAAKAVRLDVLFENDEEWYDIELQVIYQDHLPQRSRYYQSIMTVYSMERGEEYRNLKPGYVIFICLFDPFGMDMPVYSFQMCDRKNDLILDDGQFTIFLNATCTENVPKELGSFFHYLQTGEAPKGDVLLQQMDHAVEEAGNREGVRERVTLYDEMLRIQTSLDRVQAEKEQLEAERNQAEMEMKQIEARAEEALRRNRLTSALIKAGRLDELVKAEADETFRNKLMEELHS